MPRLAVLATILVAAGCGGGAATVQEAGRATPAWLDAEFSDGRVSFRYPGWWERSISPRFGTLLYLQTVYLGEVRGFEATFVWQSRTTTPLGPTMRTLGAELPSGEAVFIVLAAERPKFHSGAFGWVLKTLSVDGTRTRGGGRVVNDR